MTDPNEDAPERGADPDDAGDFQYDEAHQAVDGGPGVPGEVPDQPAGRSEPPD